MDRVKPDTLVWAPSRAVFQRRVLITGAITFAVLAIGGIVVLFFAGMPVLWAVFAAFVISLAFGIEDALRWHGAKHDRWQIDGGLLIHDGHDGRAQIPLSEITDARKTRTGRVLLSLTSGQRVLIRYLHKPELAVAQINAARAPVPN